MMITNSKIISQTNNQKVRGKIILGLVGELAAGKGTIVNYLKKKHSAVSFRYSDSLRENLELYGLEISRENMQNLSTLLRKNFGENILAKGMVKKVNNSKNNIIVIDGVRRHTDIENLGDVEGFNLIYITADQKIRYERYIERNENVGDGEMDFEQFQEKEEAETEQQIPEIGAEAKYKINNNGNLEGLHQQIENILKEINEG